MMLADRLSKRRETQVIVGFLCGLLAYLTLYFRAGFNRAEALLTLFIPDRVLAASVSGDLRQIGLADRLFVAGFAALILLWAAICGWLSLWLAGCDRALSRLEILVFAIAVGLSELSLLTLLLGLAGGLHHAVVFWLAFLAAILLGLYRWRVRTPNKTGTGTLVWCKLPGSEGERREPVPVFLGVLSRKKEKPASARRPADKSLALPSLPTTEVGEGSYLFLARHGLWLALPFVLLILLGGMMPPWEFDVREYHLQVPKEWYQAGRIGFLPHNVYGNMPLGAEMHAVLAMALVAPWADWWWGALVGKTVMACFAPLACLGLYAAVRRHVSPTAGVAAALIYISTPWVIYVSMTGLNEGVVACYALLAVAALVSWQRREDDRVPAGPSSGNADSHVQSRPVLGPLLLAGFFAGSAAACKYPALLFVVVPLAVWCWLAARKPRWKPVGVFLAAALLACAPWYAKNALLTGNPVYPLVFGGTTRTPQRMEQWNRAHRVPRDDRGRRYTPAQAAESIAMIGWRSRWLSPLLLPLACLAWLHDRSRRATMALYLLIAWVLMIWWLTTHRVDRFLVPALPWAAWLAGIGFVWSLRRPWRGMATTVLMVGLAFNFLYFISSREYDWRLLVSLADLRRDEPREPGGPSRVLPIHRYLNAAVPEGKRVLLVGDAQPFDLEVPVLYNTCFDECLFERWMRDRTGPQRREILRSHGISHIYFDWSEIARYRSPGNYGFTDWVTPVLVHNELVQQQGVLRPVPLDIEPAQGELFEVVDSAAPQAERDNATKFLDG